MPRHRNKKRIKPSQLNGKALPLVDESPYDDYLDLVPNFEVQNVSESLIKELEKWQLRMGLSEKSTIPRSHIGFYTDFS